MIKKQPSLPVAFHDPETYDVVPLTIDNIHSFQPMHNRKLGDFTRIKLNLGPPHHVRVQELPSDIAATLLQIDPEQARVIFKQCSEAIRGQ